MDACLPNCKEMREASGLYHEIGWNVKFSADNAWNPKLKLPLERAIRQADPLAQERDHLIQDRDKVHLASSLPGALPPCGDTTPS